MQAARGRVAVWALGRERDCGEVSSSSWKLSQHMDALHSSIFQGKVATSRAGAINPRYYLSSPELLLMSALPETPVSEGFSIPSKHPCCWGSSPSSAQAGEGAGPAQLDVYGSVTLSTGCCLMLCHFI